MVKKTKKKTKWRSLSFSEEDTPNGTGKEETNGASRPARANDWKIPFATSKFANHSHNHHNGNHHHHHYPPAGTRHFNGSGGGGAEKRASSKPTASRGSYNSGGVVVETKRFNDDEYTRITTPRQDVLFKKGYLSRPKVAENGIGNGLAADMDAQGPMYLEYSPTATPFYPSHMTDVLVNGSFYGNPVVLMPCSDLYYAQQHGIDVDYFSSFQYSQPFDVQTNGANDQHNSAVSSVISTTNSEHESSEDGGTTPPASSDTPISSESTTTTNAATPPLVPPPSVYDMASFYPAPIYYVPLATPDCVTAPPIPFFPVPATIGTSCEASGNEFSGEEDAAAAAVNADTELTNGGADSDCFVDSNQSESDPLSHDKVLEIATQSTLNVEVQEFRPKGILTVSKPQTAKEPSAPSSTTITAAAVPLPTKKPPRKSAAATLDKKFLIESTKQIELQNIDLNKRTGRNGFSNTSKWVVVGAKKRNGASSTPAAWDDEETTGEEEKRKDTEEPVLTNGHNGDVNGEEATTAAGARTSRRTHKKSKQRNKSQSKRPSKAKLEGFTIEEPEFVVKPVVKTMAVEQEDAIPAAATTVGSLSDAESELSVDEELLMEAMQIAATEEETIVSSPLPTHYEVTKETEEGHEETLEKTVEVVAQDEVPPARNETENEAAPVAEDEMEEEPAQEPPCVSVEVKETKMETEIVSIPSPPSTDAVKEPSTPIDATPVALVASKYHIMEAVRSWLCNQDEADLQSLFSLPKEYSFVKKIRVCAEIANHLNAAAPLPAHLVTLCNANLIASASDDEEWSSCSESENDEAEEPIPVASRRHFGCEIM